MTVMRREMRGVSKNVRGMRTDFSKQFGQMGGPIGALSNRFTSLKDTILSVHPAVAGVGAVAGAAALALKDLTAYTSTWEGALSDAGRQLASMQTGLKSFWKLASEQRGQALAEGGLGGWLKQTFKQIGGLTTGGTVGDLGTQVGQAKIINDLMLDWKKSVLDTEVGAADLLATMKELYNQFRDTSKSADERYGSLTEYQRQAAQWHDIEINNLKKELEYLEAAKELDGTDYETLRAINAVKIKIADAERKYQKLLSSTVEYQNTIRKELEKQRDALERIAILRAELAAGEYMDRPTTPKQKETTAIYDDEITKISLLKKAHIEAFSAMEEVTESWAESIVTATALSGAGLKNYVNELRRMLRTAISTYIGEAVVKVAAEAMKNAASIPVIGPLLAPAAGAAAAAAANSAFNKFIPSFGVGTPYVKRDQLAMVHEGEAIFPKSQNPFTRGRQLVAVVSGGDLKFILDEYNRKQDNSF